MKKFGVSKEQVDTLSYAVSEYVNGLGEHEWIEGVFIMPCGEDKVDSIVLGVVYNNWRMGQKIEASNKNRLHMLSGGVVAIAGVFGVIYFGKDLIDFYQSGESLTFASRLAADWEEVKVGFSAVPAIVGGMVSYNSGKKLKDDIVYRKELKKERTYKK